LPAREDPLAAAPLETDGREIADLVAPAVRSLPPLQREVVILAEYEECSLDEIARAVDAEIGTVKSRLHRARARLRRMLAPIASARYHAAERR
jgi:RNA polymerase sigma-70 factor (ECF subfamily)